MPTAKSARRAIRPRVYLRANVAIGPGKIDLLKNVAAERSISGAARAMGMSYKRAWELIAALNQDFGAPVVATTTGGRGGGGAALTPLGRALIARYAALEARLNAAAAPELAALGALIERRHRR
jgi:molybdate transport system regulatory protein